MLKFYGVEMYFFFVDQRMPNNLFDATQSYLISPVSENERFENKIVLFLS